MQRHEWLVRGALDCQPGLAWQQDSSSVLEGDAPALKSRILRPMQCYMGIGTSGTRQQIRESVLNYQRAPELALHFHQKREANFFLYIITDHANPEGKGPQHSKERDGICWLFTAGTPTVHGRLEPELCVLTSST